MRKAISIIIIIAMVTVVTSFTTVASSFAEAKDYYYFETEENIYGFGINDCNKYYIKDFNTPVAFVIENGNFTNQQIQGMITNNPIFEQRYISESGLFTYDFKFYLRDDSFSFISAAYAYTSNDIDIDGNDLRLLGENIAITGTAVNVDRMELYISYNDFYMDVNYSNSESFFRIYNNKMALNKYWSTQSNNYGFLADSIYNVVDFSNIESEFFLNVKKNSRLKNNSQELSDNSIFIYPFATEANPFLFRNWVNKEFGDVRPVNQNDFFNTDTIISGYINIDGGYTERSAQYVGLNTSNNRQIWKLELPISIDINEATTLKYSARNGAPSHLSSYISTDIIPLSSESIIIENKFSWGSLLELTGIFGVTVDLILQILSYDILGIEIGFLIFAPLLFSISIGIIKRIRG